MEDDFEDLPGVGGTKAAKSPVMVGLTKMRGKSKPRLTISIAADVFAQIDGDTPRFVASFSTKQWALRVKHMVNGPCEVWVPQRGERKILRVALPPGVTPSTDQKVECEFEVVDGALYINLPVNWRPLRIAAPAPNFSTKPLSMGDPPPGRSALDQRNK